MGFLSLDGTFWFQLINFAIFFVILNVVFLKPVGRAVAQRRAYIDSLVEGCDTANAQVHELQSQIEGKRASARREAEAAISRARAEGSNESAAIASEYAQRSAAIIAEAQRTVENELIDARGSLESRASELADLMLDRALPGGRR